MSGDPAGSVTHAFARLRAGDANAASRLWGHFFPRLVGLARHTLAGRPQQVADAEDAAVSAFAAFWHQASDGDFSEVMNRNDLWKLLGTVTVRKAMKQARKEIADRRGGGRVLGEGALALRDGTPTPLDEAVGRLPACDFDLSSAELLETLDEELREIALLRLMGHKNREIADQLGCTERKVERKLNLIRLQWESEFPG